MTARLLTHRLTLGTTRAIEILDLTETVRHWVRETGVRQGLLTVMSPHTTARITINEREVRVVLCGLNSDPRQLDLCRQLLPRAGNRFVWVAADACALPFAAYRFDRLLCVEAMFHFASRRRFMAEAARVLRASGVLVASDLIVSAAARALDSPSFPIRRVLDEGYGPWPDFWGEEGGHHGLAREAGLHCSVLEDVGEQVRPSHRFTAPSGITLREALASPAAGPAARAALMLKWLHDEGHLRYVLLRLEPAAR